MPFYEYKCLNCEHGFEELVRSEEALQALRCPQCGSDRLSKLLSIFGMVTSSGRHMTSAPGGGAACSGCAKTSCASCK